MMMMMMMMMKAWIKEAGRINHHRKHSMPQLNIMPGSYLGIYLGNLWLVANIFHMVLARLLFFFSGHKCGPSRTKVGDILFDIFVAGALGFVVATFLPDVRS